jgi:hypothetical protein
MRVIPLASAVLGTLPTDFFPKAVCDSCPRTQLGEAPTFDSPRDRTAYHGALCRLVRSCGNLTCA